MKYDVIVVGGGHAGSEACLASARLGMKTLLITGNINMIASMPCNPSVGGPAKGIVVREIDALGGQMGINSDASQIQMKMLNSSKGPAVRALRAQNDKLLYSRLMGETVLHTKNLEVKEGYVEGLCVDEDTISGVLFQGEKIEGKTVILTTGTYLASRILRGHHVETSGPDNQPTSFGISESLRQLGFEIIRLKTGTPPRIYTSSIDFSEVKEERGDEKLSYFHFENEWEQNGKNINVPCYLTYTNPTIHQIILSHLDDSAMYGGVIQGLGPRYCPSIETKVVRFKDKEQHQVFFEPESLELDTTYIQGFSTSMPEDIQDLMIHAVPGLEHAKVQRYSYAIEYDAINPLQLKPSLETKKIHGLFCGGQINGTSGYEEAACQGLIAGINAVRFLQEKEPLILKRNEAYIGVLIDDLVTKGVIDPYRLLTSRAEYRLLLRHDNADERLIHYGHEIGLVSEERYQKYEEKQERILHTIEEWKITKYGATKEMNEFLARHNSALLKDGISYYDLIKRPELNVEILSEINPSNENSVVLENAEIKVKYAGYIDKANKDAEKLSKAENIKIPEDFDYDEIHNLASEAKEKCKQIKPISIGQASRISGVNPNDIAMILIYLESRRKS